MHIGCQFLTAMNLFYCSGMLCMNSGLINVIINKAVLSQGRKSCRFPTINTPYVVKVIYRHNATSNGSFEQNTFKSALSKRYKIQVFMYWQKHHIMQNHICQINIAGI